MSTADTSGRVLLDRPVPGVAVVTLNYPQRMNSMSFDVMLPLRDVLREIDDDNEVRAVVLTGAGKGFCSGADHSGERGRMPHVEGLTQVTVALRAMEILDDVVLALPSPATSGWRGSRRSSGPRASTTG